MDKQQMDALIEQHIRAEQAGDTAGAVAVYTDDVVHDVVGAPHGPLHGPEAAQGFYDWLTSQLSTDAMDVTKSWYGEDFCVVEHQATATVNGEFMGIPGNGRTISFRMLHVWEFRDEKISRENIWMDSGAIIGQLTAPEEATAVA